MTTTPDTYPKPSEEQVAARMAEVREVLAAARERFVEQQRTRQTRRPT